MISTINVSNNISTTKINFFQTSIINWHEKCGRKTLLWQLKSTPYHTWLSEIMLQQTQVSTVTPYFERFIKKFPTIKRLANAQLDEVLSLWSGLGYYSRAKNLHQTAKIIAENFDGNFPKDLETLQTFPGIGRSTAGAILALSFNQPAPILDGNVKRVLSRFNGVTAVIDHQYTKKLWELSNTYTPKNDAAIYTQAIMDIGATICTPRKPNCSDCPLQTKCFAYHHQLTESIPAKKPKKTLPTRQAIFLIIKNKDHKILFVKQPPVGIWSHLWTFPQIENEADIEKICRISYGCKTRKILKLKPFRHTFSHFHLQITPILVDATIIYGKIMEAPNVSWYDAELALTLGLPKPIRDLLEQLQ